MLSQVFGSTGSFVMPRNVGASMSESPNKPSEFKEKSAVTAVVKAHDMLIDLCGQRGWNDTRESWLARGARKARLSLRRARAIFYQEPIRLTADEYIAIQEAFETANAAVAAIRDLAGDADLRRYPAPESEGRRADAQARPSPVSAVR